MRLNFNLLFYGKDNYFLLKAINNFKKNLLKSSTFQIGLYMKKNIMTVFCSIMVASFAPSSFGENLLGIYRQALQNDPEWAAIESNYEADQEKVIQAKSTLKPSVFINYSKSRITRAAGDVGVGLNNDLNQGINDCLLPAGGVTATCTEDLLTIMSDPNASLFQIIESGSSDNSTTTDNFSLQLSQPLLNLERLYTYRVSKSSLLKTKSDFNNAQQQFFLRIATAYFDTLKAKQELLFAQSENKAIYDQVQQTKTRYELGLIRITDVHEAQSSLDLSRSLVILADGVLQNAYEQLNAMTNGNVTDITPLSPDFTAAEPKPSSSDLWVDIALKNSEKIVSSKAAVDAAKLDVIQKQSGRVPTVDLFARLDNVKTGSQDDDSPFGSAGNLTSDSDTESIGINVVIPIYTGGLVSSKVRESRHRRDATQGRLEQTIRSVSRTVKNSYRQVENDLKRIGVFIASLESTKRSLKSTTDGYNSGSRNISDVLQAERKVFSTRRDLSNAKIDYILNSLRLKMAAGLLKPDDLLTVNNWLANGAAAQ